MSGGLFALQASAGFVAAPSYPARYGTVVVADFNGDGKLDVATSGGSLLLGNGDGTFQPAQDYGASGVSMVVGDFNKDGVVDIAVVLPYGAENMMVLLGNGDGTFQPAKTYSAGPNPSSVAVGDFNGDGSLDLVVTNSSIDDNTVSVLLGNGDGTFHPPQSFAAGAVPYAVAVGDFNRDGILDLAVANQSEPGSVSILLGNGDGTFQSPQSFGVGPAPASVAVGDLNGDGVPDLAVANSGQNSDIPGNTVSILLGNGDGTFQAAQDYATDDGTLSVALADFNGDGNLDLVAVNGYAGTVSIFLGKGDGTFQTAENYAGSYAHGAVAVGDFNGDGRPDLVVTSDTSPGTLDIFLGKGDGTFRAAPSYGVGLVPVSVAVADFNGDGIPDLAVANKGFTINDSSNSSAVSILLGNGDGTFGAARDFAAGNEPIAVVAGDFNGDGIPDLAVANGYGAVSIGLGHGDGSFGTFLSYPLAGRPSALAVGDFNGDGIPDLALATSSGLFTSALNILLGNGDGTFRMAGNFPAGQGVTSLAVADFNGDGKADLVTTNFEIYGSPRMGYDVHESDVRVYLGNGDGTFQDAQIYVAGLGPVSVAVGDFNHDGMPDLAVANGGDPPNPGNSISVLLGKGDGTFQAAQSYAAGFLPSSVTAGDFNRDGNLDLAVTSQWGVSILLGDGTGVFRPVQSYAAGIAGSVAVADLNRDGYPDLVVARFPGPPGPVAGQHNVSVILNAADWGGSN